MRTKDFTRAVLLLVCLCCMTACGDDKLDPNSYEALSRQHIGEFTLKKIHWDGQSVDMNNDGVARWDLLENEMDKALGYYPPNHEAKVEEGKVPTEWNGRPFLNVLAQLPYPLYESSEKGHIVKRIAYLPVNLQMIYYDNLSSTIINHVPHSDESDIFIGKIEEILISEFKPETFTIRVRCTMYDLNQEETTNYLRYTYERK